jgi:predicted dehydrogenase
MQQKSTALPIFKNLVPNERIGKSISVALVGYGRQGELIIDALPRIPGVHIAAIADIWPWRRELAKNRLRALRLAPNLYETLDEMLDAEGDKIDAVIIATPDWQHVNHVSACLKANKHVYCDGEISDNSVKAQELVTFAGEKELLVQCGHQRRSNPSYVYVFEKLNHDNKIPGVVTHAYTQWHRSITPLIHVPNRIAMSIADLQRHGYENMEQLLNWEWFTRFGLGDVAYRTGQKIDLLRWFWNAEPCSVTAIGGNDYYNRQAPDCLMSIFTFKLPTGEIRRGYVQVLSTNSSGGDVEKFGATRSLLHTSEIPSRFKLICVRPSYPYFDDGKVYERVRTLIKYGMLLSPKKAPPPEFTGKVSIDMRCEQPEITELLLPFQTTTPPILPHLENFISAIRDSAKLRDPIEQATKNLIALEAAVQSARERRTIDLA